MTTALLESYDLAGVTLANRMVMAPMTRTRSSDDGVQASMNAEYYAQRASAGLLVSECTAVSAQSAGIIRAPGIFTDEQAEGWRGVVDAVHLAGGRIYLQLWHCGRISHPALQPGGELPVAPSPVAAEGQIFTPTGPQDFPVPRELDLPEISAIVEDFRRGAVNAKAAGFDGVELHGAFGYLCDQFLQDATNQRTDAYGGSVANRARFTLEVVDALIDVWGAQRVGVKLSPSNRFYGMFDSDAGATFGYVLDALEARGIGYVHLMEPNDTDRASGTVQIDDVARHFRSRFTAGAVMANGSFDHERAVAILEEGGVDLVSFGVPFVANPDLPERYAQDAPLNQPDPSTFYGHGPGGYVDYPTLTLPSGSTPLDHHATHHRSKG